LTGSTSFRPEIEGLRALAVCAVIAHHFVGLDGGFIGVDIFFVISGYLIGGLLLRELRDIGRIDFQGFLARRVRRLLPNGLLTLIATLIVGLCVMPASQWDSLAHKVSAAALYVANFSNARQSFGYFSPGIAANPVMHFWSLSIEEQFYLGIAAVFAAATLARSRAVAAVLAFLWVATVVSFVASVLADRSNGGPNFFLTQFRVWELGWCSRGRA
jgi:peptidoglycan/LPS O-acetylase OafA/YrhL